MLKKVPTVNFVYNLWIYETFFQQNRIVYSFRMELHSCTRAYENETWILIIRNAFLTKLKHAFNKFIVILIIVFI